MIENDPQPSSRQMILEAAIEEFAEYGLEGARVDRIASRARVNKAMIYYHFNSKDELYRQVLDHHIQAIAQIAKQKISELAGLESTLLKIAELYGAMLGSQALFRPILLRELASGGERLRASLDRIILQSGLPGYLRQLIEQGIAEGRYRPVDARHVILSFIGMNMFYLVMAPIVNAIWEIDDEEAFRRERPRAVVDLFLNGIMAHEEK